MNPGATLVIRADASIAMGTGHVMRCLALAQAWRHVGGNVIFVMAESTPAIERRLQVEGFEVVQSDHPSGSERDANNLAELSDKCDAAWVAVDGYQFDSAYQYRIKDADFRLLWIDDTGHCAPYCADFVLNQNSYAHPGMYPSCDSTLLLGSRYALLREEFLPWRSWQRDFPLEARHLLITMGGSDPQNFTAHVLGALGKLDVDIEITVVIGGSNPQSEQLRRLVEHRRRKFQLQLDVKDISGLMARADLAISAAGGSCYELALLQVPMVLIALAENQRPTAWSLSKQGAAIDAGWFHDFDGEQLIEAVRRLTVNCVLRRSLGQNARRMVDGNGAQRVCELLLHHEELQAKTPKLQVGAV